MAIEERKLEILEANKRDCDEAIASRGSGPNVRALFERLQLSQRSIAQMPLGFARLRP